MQKLVAYTQVSTAHQGEHGLGIAAQKRAITEYTRTSEAEIIQPIYVEVESGGRDDRPILATAVRQARTYDATLIVAKADRLTRSGESVESFARRNHVKIITLDNVNGDDLLAEMQAAVFKIERKLISKRTTAALAALKAQGKALGGYRGNLLPDYVARLGADAGKARADLRASDALVVIAQVDPDRSLSLAAMAAALNQRGVATARGGRWSATQVARVQARG